MAYPGLVEAERAISALDGRHVEQQRARREMVAAAEERRTIIDRELARRARRRLRAAFICAIGLAAAAVVAGFAWTVVERTRQAGAALRRAEKDAPFPNQGWIQLATNAVMGRPSLEANLPGSSCFVALSTGDQPMRVHAAKSTVVAARSIAWCGCEAAHVTVESSAGGSGSVGLEIMRIDARALGGAFARGWASPAAGAWAEGGEECAGAAFDGWIDDGHSPTEMGSPVVRGAAAEVWPYASEASLRAAGMRPIEGIGARQTFAVVRASGGDCVVAVARDSESLSLRARGDRWLISGATQAMAWCSSEGMTTSVWRRGSSPVSIFEGRAAQLGGLLGVREWAQAIGVSVGHGATWLRDEDLPWDAACLLRASLRLSSGDVTAEMLPAAPGAPDARITALSLSAGATAVATSPATLMACDPSDGAEAHSPAPVSLHPLPRATVCSPAGPVAFWRDGDAPVGAARAPMPFWLVPLESRRQWGADDPIPRLLGLARHLGAIGFTPTLLEGVTELADGVRVVGRAGEDAIVAIGIGSNPPWVFPYGDAHPWRLGGLPTVVALGPGQVVSLRASPTPVAPLDKRRTVVFRRLARD